MIKFWIAALGTGGLATIGAALFWSLYKGWLKIPIFANLSQDQTFIIMMVFLSLVFVAFAFLIVAYIVRSKSRAVYNAPGGKGGNAKASKGAIAIGGPGGNGGIGPGGPGGNASAEGDGSFSLGGEGGEGAQPDRPAKGGRGPFEVLGVGDKIIPGVGRLGDFGRGGDGAFGDIPAQPGGKGLVIIRYIDPDKSTPEEAPKGKKDD